MQGVMDIIRAVRNLRADLKVQPGHRARLMLRPQEGWADILRAAEPHFLRLASASELTLLGADDNIAEKIVSAVSPAAEVLIPLGDLVDLRKEAQRLQKERDGIMGEIARSEGKLNNQGFLAKAPEALVAQERQKLEDNRAMLLTLDKRLEDLRG